MDHYFNLNSSKGMKVFLPITSVLKNDPPTATNTTDHPYNTRSKDKHNVHNDDPEATINIIQKLSQKEGQSADDFMSEQLEHQENIELKKRQEEAAKRPPGEDFDMRGVDVNEQERLYIEAQRASKQAGEKQNQNRGNAADHHSNGTNDSQQHGGRHNQPPVNPQGSSVDPCGYGYGAGQQLHGSQFSQHQNQHPGYQYGPNVDSTTAAYGHNVSQHHFHGSQPLQHQLPHHQDPHNPSQQYPHYHQPGAAIHRPAPHYLSQQYPPPQPDPMALIPRAGVGDNHYNPATGMPYGQSSSSRRQVSHTYEPIPGLVDQPDPHSQQYQQAPDSNPYNLEAGSMILHGDPPSSGVVKWIGHLPEVIGLLAGIEMVSSYVFRLIYQKVYKP